MGISYENLMISHVTKPVKDESKITFDASSESYYACRAHIVDLLKITQSPNVMQASVMNTLWKDYIFQQKVEIEFENFVQKRTAGAINRLATVGQMGGFCPFLHQSLCVQSSFITDSLFFR